MQRKNVFLVGLLLIVLLVPAGFSAAQDGGVPFPADAGDAYLLFPDVVQDAPAGMGTLQQRYILLAKAGNILSVTAAMSEPGVVTRLELYDASGMVLVEGMPDAAAPTAISVNYEAMAEGWYYVNVSLGAALSPTSFYSLALTGTTRAVYDVLGLDAPPTIPGAHLVLATGQVNGALEATPLPFVFPLAAGDALKVTAQGTSQPRLRITTFEDGAPAQTLIAEAPQAGSPVSYNTTSDKAQWVRIDVEPTMTGDFTLDVSLPRASGMVSDLGETGAVSTGVSAGASGAMCGGIPARFAVGDTIIVSPEGDNLLLLNDYTAGSGGSLALAVTGDTFEVLTEPVCYSSPGYGEDIWFWEVFSFDANMSGWIADGLSTERWVCPQNDPNCNQTTTCDLPHADVGVGDMLVVSEIGDNLQIMRYAGANEQVMALAVTGDLLEVLAEPVCYYSDWHGSGLWYWNVYSETDGMAGWVVDGTSDETWVCPASNPTCDQ